jgi:hypothetical protein
MELGRAVEGRGVRVEDRGTVFVAESFGGADEPLGVFRPWEFWRGNAV